MTESELPINLEFLEPVLPILVVAELAGVLIRWRGFHVYSLWDILDNIGCMLGFLLRSAVFRYGPLAGYALVYQDLALVKLDASSMGVFVAGVVLADAGYYWWHRANHRVALLWAVHVVHHSSNHLNMSTNLRFSWFANISAWIFYLPLAVIGFPPVVIAGALAISDTWGLLGHTRVVPKLGPLEWLLVTPSNHRVHHGADAKYVDKNYGSIFIFWDKLFGTYQVEEEEPRYGLQVPLETHNPLRINLSPFVELFREARAAPGVFGWLKVLALPPGANAQRV